jgi:hypothetical protein
MRLLLSTALLLASAPSLAGQPVCPTPAQHVQFGAFRDRLASASTPEKAKKIALSKLKLGHQAIDAAAGLVQDADGLADARGKLDALQDAVNAAEDQAQVAAAFGSLDTQAVHCDYDTVEIVVIVIGFVLGILPGILFLFLFC